MFLDLGKKIYRKLRATKPHPPTRFRGMERREILHCPLCGSDRSQHAFQVWSGEDAVRSKICLNCGLAYLYETLQPQHLEGLGKHGGSLVMGKKNTEDVLKAGNNVMKLRGARYFEFINKHVEAAGKTHLDVTCQYGGVVEAFQARGCRSSGIDNSAELVEFGLARSLSLFKGEFLEFEFEQKYDIVTMPRVINHYVNPLDYLLKAKEILTPDGVIFIEQFDFNHAIRRKGIYRALNLDHPVMFTYKTLKTALAMVGLEVIAYSNDDEPNFKFESLNHCHVICKPSSQTKINYDPQGCFNDMILASQQYLMTDKFDVYY